MKVEVASPFGLRFILTVCVYVKYCGISECVLTDCLYGLPVATQREFCVN